MKRYFSAESERGSSSSYGFSNDTRVLCFSSKSARDKYVAQSKNLSCCKILARNATKEAANFSLTHNRTIKPDTFRGEFWGIIEYDEEIDGCIGILAICDEYYPFGADRFYK